MRLAWRIKIFSDPITACVCKFNVVCVCVCVCVFCQEHFAMSSQTVSDIYLGSWTLSVLGMPNSGYSQNEVILAHDNDKHGNQIYFQDRQSDISGLLMTKIIWLTHTTNII